MTTTETQQAVALAYLYDCRLIRDRYLPQIITNNETDQHTPQHTLDLFDRWSEMVQKAEADYGDAIRAHAAELNHRAGL